MDVLSWAILAVVVIAGLAGRAKKVRAGISAIQARAQAAQDQMAAYSEQMQAAAAQAAAVAAPRGPVNSPAYTAAPAYAAPAPGPPPAPAAARRAVMPSVVGSLRAAAAGPATSGAPLAGMVESPGAARSFLHDAFADPLHARRAIILAEILQPPPALR